MAKVKQLPSSLSRLLCSGQIITSVFCVVKELVENSLDAQCSSIDVKLENYGLDKVEVRDNGCGIHSDDIPHMVKSHYTSKISRFEDLKTLKTFGFRGEALAALSSVADITVCSKTCDEDISMTYVFSNSGEVVTSKPSASPQGTTVIAANLFKNIPVRKQIFKSEKIKKEELKKIQSLLCSFACSELGVRFALYHDRNVIWQKSAVNDIRSAMIQIYGSSTVNNMIPISNSDETLKIKVEGFFPKPDAPISNFSHISSDRTIVTINKRPVRIKEIDKVLQKHYLQCVDFSGSKTRYPFCFLSISLPPCKIDVNIEPNKTSVLVHSLEEVKSFLAQSLAKLHSPTSSPKTRTELPALDHKLLDDSLSTESLCDENKNLLNSEQSARGNNSAILSSSSALISNTCYQIRESHDNFEDDILKIPAHTRSTASDDSKQLHDIVKNKNLSESTKYTPNYRTCRDVENKFCFLPRGDSDVPRNAHNQQTVLKTGVLVENLKEIPNTDCTTTTAAESFLKKLSGNASPILQPLNIQSSYSLGDEPSANGSINPLNDSVIPSAQNSHLSERRLKSAQDICKFPAMQNDQTTVHPCYSQCNSSLINTYVINKRLDSVRCKKIHSSKLNTSSCQQIKNNFQSILSFVGSMENAQTCIVPRDSTTYNSSNSSALLDKCSNSSFERIINSNLKVPDSEEVQNVRFQTGSLLSRSIKQESVLTTAANPSVSGEGNKLCALAAAAQKQKTGNWSMGNLYDSGGNKLEPVSIHTKSPVKRTAQEEDFISDVKRKKSVDNTCDTPDLGAKQLKKSTLNAFGLFCRESRLEVALQNPGLGNQDIAKLLTEEWNNLPLYRKVSYEKKAVANVSSRKVKKKLGATLSQTLLALNEKKKKPSAKKVCIEDQELIKSRKAIVVQFHLEDLKAKSAEKISECCKEMRDEKHSVIGCLSPESWICLKGSELLLLNSFRLREVLIYNRLMETYVFPSEKLSAPITLHESLVGGDVLWKIMFELPRDSTALNGTFIADKRITSNGFKIQIGKGGHSATLIEMPSCLPFSGVSDLVEILKHLKQKKESATLCDCRPAKAVHFLQGEAVRIVRQSPSKLSKDEVEELLKQRKNMLPETNKVCIHNKPFFHVLYNMDALHSQKSDSQDH